MTQQELFDSIKRIAKADHTCDNCGGAILKGSVYWNNRHRFKNAHYCSVACTAKGEAWALPDEQG